MSLPTFEDFDDFEEPFDFPDESLPQAADNFEEPFDAFYESLLQAARGKRYPTLYALLSKLTGPLGPEQAFSLANLGLELSIRAFRAILDRCPPPADFVALHDPLEDQEPFKYSNIPFSLLDKAAYDNRAEHLDELLRRGCDPNGSPGFQGSVPLLAAFLGQSADCAKRLVQEPELDCTLARDFLHPWAKLGRKDTEDLAQCCLAAAPRLMGEVDGSPTGPLTFHGIPVPRQLKGISPLAHRNWSLAEHLFRREPLAVREGSQAAFFLALAVRRLSLRLSSRALTWSPHSDDISQQELISLLDALFSACPQLLRQRLPRTLLLFAALTGKSVSPVLHPWLDRLPGKKMILDPAPGLSILALALLFWEKRLGSRWIPVLDPKTVSPGIIFQTEQSPLSSALAPNHLDIFFSLCQIRDFPPGRELTGLSLATLHMASMPQLIRQLQPGGLLRKEDPKVLVDHCLDPKNYCAKPQGRRYDPYSMTHPLTPQRRQAVLAHIALTADYTL